jgi:TonB family protein
MSAPESNDEFLHRIRVRPQPRFAKELKMRLDQSSTQRGHSMSGYIDVSAPISSRSLALFAIIGLHVALIFAFANGLVQRISGEKFIPIVANSIELEQRSVEAPIPVKPMLDTFKIPVPKPLAPIEAAPDAPTGSTIDESPERTQSGTAVAAINDSLIHAGIGRNFPNPDAFYPASAIRQEIEGKAIVRVCIGPDGKLAQAPQIAQSTQSRMLDEAALHLARAGSYVAGSRGGVAVTDCFNFQTKFQIKNRG